MRERLLGAKRLIAYASLAALVALVAITGVWQVAESRRSLRSQVLEGNRATARITAAAIGVELQTHLQQVQQFAARDELAEVVRDRDWSTLADYLGYVPLLFPEFTDAGVFTPDGILRAGAPFDASVAGRDYAARDYFRGAVASSGGAFLSDVFRARRDGVPSIAFSAPMVIDGQLAGVLALVIPAQRLRVMDVATSVPNGGSFIVVDRSGDPASEPLADPRTIAPHDELIDTLLAGHEYLGDATVPGRPGMRLVAGTPIADLGWAVIVEQPPIAYAPVRALTGRLGLIVALVVVFALVAAGMVGRALSLIERERNRAIAILASISDGAVFTDPAGHIVALNDAMERMTLMGARVLIGTQADRVFEIVTPTGERFGWGDRLVREAVRGRGTVSTGATELGLMVGDHIVPVSLTSSPVFDERRALLGVVTIVRDVTAERELDHLKDSLISTVSHELRTPLTMIQGFSELLMERPAMDTAAVREGLSQIHGSAQRLGRLIDDVLSVSSIEAGRVGLDLRPLDVRKAVDEVARPLAVHAERPLTITCPSDLPLVQADPDTLARILTNLVSNAIKYSPVGTPIEIACARASDMVRIDVTDHGFGLTPEEQRRVFDKFSRIDRPEVHRAGGTGLGLFITRSLVEMQHGALWVTSERGKGSTFSFTVHSEGSQMREEHDEEAAYR